MLNLEQAKQITSNFHSILSCNCQSFNQSHFKIKYLIDKLKFPQICLLQEVWQPKICTKIPNYQTPIQSLRNTNRGGGLSIYIRDDIDYHEHNEINTIVTNNIEKLAVVIKNKKQFILINIYRPPNTHFNESLKEIGKIIDLATKSGLPFCLVGDFNIDLTSGNYTTNRYTDLIQTFNCIQTENERQHRHH
jgi:hypothetical protein